MSNKVKLELKPTQRSCGDCTKCCEGYLTGSAHGHEFYPGRPCHFLSIGTGCTIYSQRPKEPCVSFKCEWLDNSELPEWLKPNQVNAIVMRKKLPDTEIEFLSLVEAGDTLDSRTLTWVLMYALRKQLNLMWAVDGAKNWIGTPEFLAEMAKENNK